MSRKKMKPEKQTTVRLDSDLVEWLSVLRDGQNLPSVNDAVRIALLRAYPNIEEIVELSRKREAERKSQLGDVIPKADEPKKGDGGNRD